MSKLALLLGTSGSGKGWVTSNLTCRPHVLTVDLIREDAINFLCRDLKPGVIHRWPIWDCLLEHFDVPPAIAFGIRKRCEELDRTRHVVAEGGLLAHAGFREAFLQALQSLDCRFDESKTFYLDTPAAQVLDNVRRRGRPEQRDFTLNDACKSVRWYRRQARRCCDVRLAAAEQMVEAIDSYFAT